MNGYAVVFLSIALLCEHFNRVNTLLEDLDPKATKPDGRENKSIEKPDTMFYQGVTVKEKQRI